MVRTVSVTTNGVSAFSSSIIHIDIACSEPELVQVLCFGICSTSYSETNLPTSTFSGVTIFAYWDDLFIYPSTSQGIYYTSEGNAPNRTLVFEFYMSHFNQPSQYYHYQILFFESRPNIVQYKYYDASDGGITCTIGVQG